MNNQQRSKLVVRLKSELRLKLFLLVALNVIVWIPYITLQHFHFFEATVMPLTLVDRSLPFLPSTVWAYLSIYALMPIGPFLMDNRAQIFRYARGVIAIGGIATVLFFFWPTICPRPSGPNGDSLYRALISIDQPFHAFPSLHAAFAVYSCLCVMDVGRATGWSQNCEIIFITWTAVILLATLLTRQHVVVDIIAGSALGFGAYQICLRQNVSLNTAACPQFSHED